MYPLPVIKHLLDAYKEWVITNPNVVTDVEALTKWTSYFIAGKLNKSAEVSELIYSLSNLFVLYNDTLILKSQPDRGKNKRKDSLKFWMTVIHFTEVFVEMTAKNRWGSRGKWSAVTLLQLIKCIANFILVHHYREIPVQHPPISSINRKNINEFSQDVNGGFRLRRSGRVIRSVENAPLTQLRDWKPLEIEEDTTEESNNKTAETLYILKPMLHLSSMALFGRETWKQWLVSLAIDLSSFSLYNQDLKNLNYEQRVEISRRKLFLLYYLLRSPMYNKYSKTIINNFLKKTAKNIPFAGFICNPILQYISVWQDTYFYMWSN